VTADTLGSSYDTALAAYAGSSWGTLVPLGCDDDGGPGLLSQLTFPVAAGTTYYIQVGGSLGAFGDLIFNLQVEPAINLAALDMDPTGNTVALVPSGNVEETTLGNVEECIEVTHPATFDVDFVVQGYPPTEHSLVGYDVSLTFPAGLQLTDSFTGDIAPGILGRTLISGDPQSGSFVAFVDLPNYGGGPLVGPATHSASVVDFAPFSTDESIDGEENSDGFLVRYTFETTAAGPALLSLTLSTIPGFVIDDLGDVPITTVQGGVVAVDTSCPPTPLAADADGDGFSNGGEAFMGTDPLVACPATGAARDEEPDQWPPDVDDNQRVNLWDLLPFKQHFGAMDPTDPVYNPRYDLNADERINIVDVLRMKPFFGLSCA
jgi:hypothetical protein